MKEIRGYDYIYRIALGPDNLPTYFIIFSRCFSNANELLFEKNPRHIQGLVVKGFSLDLMRSLDKKILVDPVVKAGSRLLESIDLLRNQLAEIINKAKYS